jgi:hypothetical protein
MSVPKTHSARLRPTSRRYLTTGLFNQCPIADCAETELSGFALLPFEPALRYECFSDRDDTILLRRRHKISADDIGVTAISECQSLFDPRHSIALKTSAIGIQPGGTIFVPKLRIGVPPHIYEFPNHSSVFLYGPSIPPPPISLLDFSLPRSTLRKERNVHFRVANVPDHPRPASGRMMPSDNGFILNESIMCDLPSIKGVVLGRAC